jgi:cellulose synthase/poly-beta-1,6-N-acetylglucosamine synthase-like glycosyltransferase
MSKSSPQHLKNHGRIDPPFHFVLFFFLAANLVFAVFHMIHHWDDSYFASKWYLLLSLVVFIPFFKLRTYPLRVQDRVIRLEERLRLQALAPAAWHSQIHRLTENQLIGLRFAADDEVVALAKQALEHNLNRKQIKERIQNWRADHFRV